MSDSQSKTFKNEPLLKCIWVLREQADVSIEENDFEAAATMLENTASLCWILQKRLNLK